MSTRFPSYRSIGEALDAMHKEMSARLEAGMTYQELVADKEFIDHALDMLMQLVSMNAWRKQNAENNPED